MLARGVRVFRSALQNDVSTSTDLLVSSGIKRRESSIRRSAEAAAAELAAAGANVVFTSRTLSAASRAATEIGGGVVGFEAHVTDECAAARSYYVESVVVVWNSGLARSTASQSTYSM